MTKTHLLTAAALALAAVAGPAPPAWACLSCGCGGSGTSSDLGAVGGAAAIFSMGHRWLVQEGVSFRSISGSFNERGTWNPVPVDGSLSSFQSTLGLSYFPTLNTSFGIQLPVVANALDKATWGPLGSINPTDLQRATGATVGDVAIQGTAKLYEAPWWAVAGWLGGSAPTGTSTGDPQTLSGAGVYNASGGLVLLAQPGDWELSANLGYQRPLTQPTFTASTFYIGEAFMYQAQVNRRLNDTFRAGLGLNGYTGQGRFGATDLPFNMAKIKVVPSLQVALTQTEGVRLAAGLDPTVAGANAMTDMTVYAVFYQYVP